MLGPIASPIDKIVLGRRHSVNDWLSSAYMAVCLQEGPLSLQDGRRLGVDDVIRINAVRYYHIPDQRPHTIPLSDRCIEDAFELLAKKAQQGDVVESQLNNGVASVEANPAEGAAKEHKPESGASIALSQTASSAATQPATANEKADPEPQPASGDTVGKSAEPSIPNTLTQVPGVARPANAEDKISLASRLAKITAAKRSMPSTPNLPDQPSTPTPKKKNNVKKSVEENSNKFLATRNLDQAEAYLRNLAHADRFLLVDKLVNTVIESKVADAQLIGDFFARAVEKGLCSQASFEQGFMPIAKIIDDIAIDTPKTFDLMAVMMKGACLDEATRKRIASRSFDSQKLLALLGA